MARSNVCLSKIKEEGDIGGFCLLAPGGVSQTAGRVQSALEKMKEKVERLLQRKWECLTTRLFQSDSAFT